MVPEYLPLVERTSRDRARGQPTATVGERVPLPERRVLPDGPLPITAVHDLAAVYATYFVEVARWVRGFGANDADVEDLTQEIFIIVGRKLERFDGRNLRGFLYRITQRTVRDHRRSPWYRRAIRGELPIEWLLFVTTESAGMQAVDRLHLRRTLGIVLAHMSEKLRTTFIMFEVDGYTGDEIAQIQSLPIRTVWTRLHYARRSFARIATELVPEGLEGEERTSFHSEGSIESPPTLVIDHDSRPKPCSLRRDSIG